MKELPYERPEPPPRSVKKVEHKKPAAATVPIPTKKVSTIRTYKADVTDLIEEKKITKTQIAIAESEARQKRGESSALESRDPESTILPLVAGIILLLSSAYLVLSSGTLTEWLSRKSDGVTARAPLQGITSIQLNEHSRAAAVGGITLLTKRISVPQNTKQRIILTGTFGTTTRPFSGAEFLDLIEAHAPNELSRSMEPEFELGFASSGETKGYLRFTTTFYENTVFGMLGWEAQLPNDLYGIIDPFRAQYATTTPTGSWKDRTWGTYALRVYESSEGKPVIIYGWADTHNIIITSSLPVFDLVTSSFKP